MDERRPESRNLRLRKEIVGMKVIQNGVGFIGQQAIRLMLRKGIDVVGAIGHRKHLDEDVGKLVGMGEIGVNVTNDVQSVLAKTKADIVSDATITELHSLYYNELKQFIDAGINVASISEVLSFPWVTYPELSKEIDENAKAHNVTIVGTGVNPGLVMDFMPLAISSACWNIDRIKIKRVVDFSVYSPTRGTLRFGIKPEDFRRGVKEGRIPLHQGFCETLSQVAAGLGFKLDEIREKWDLLVSKSVRPTKWFTVHPGEVTGFSQTAMGLVNGESRIELNIYCIIHPSLEEDGVESGQWVWINGEPDINMVIKFPDERGDLSTTARLVNVLPAVVEAKPGLLSVKDLPPNPPLPDRKFEERGKDA